MPNFDLSILGLLKFVGIPALISGLGIWTGLRFFAKNFVNHEFSKKLEEFRSDQIRKLDAIKADQSQSLEKLRFDISASLDRTAKLHQHEFDVLPKAWALLQRAGGSAAAVCTRLKSYEDVSKMTVPQLGECFSRYELAESEKSHLLSLQPRDRQLYFQECVNKIRLQKAFDDHIDLHNYLLDMGIFIHSPADQKLRDLAELIRDGLIEQRIEMEDPTPRVGRWEKSEQFLRDWVPGMEAARAEIKGRLWDARLPSIDQQRS